ncbi:unnamed protein product, partial [Amoebophrya sp. A120]
VTYHRFKTLYWERFLKPAAAGGFSDDYAVYREILAIKAGRRRHEDHTRADVLEPQSFEP